MLFRDNSCTLSETSAAQLYHCLKRQCCLAESLKDMVIFIEVDCSASCRKSVCEANYYYYYYHILFFFFFYHG